jgi:hypothetical protein
MAPKKPTVATDAGMVVRDTLKMHFSHKVVPVLEIEEFDVDTLVQLVGKLLHGSAALKSAPPVVVRCKGLEDILENLVNAYEWLGREAKRNIHEGMRDFPENKVGLFTKERAEGRLCLNSSGVTQTPLAIITIADEVNKIKVDFGEDKILLKKVQFDFSLSPPGGSEFSGHVAPGTQKVAWIRKSVLERQKAKNLNVKTDPSGKIVLVDG